LPHLICLYSLPLVSTGAWIQDLLWMQETVGAQVPSIKFCSIRIEPTCILSYALIHL
jgi:hypothetical protein